MFSTVPPLLRDISKTALEREVLTKTESLVQDLGSALHSDWAELTPLAEEIATMETNSARSFLDDIASGGTVTLKAALAPRS